MTRITSSPSRKVGQTGLHVGGHSLARLRKELPDGAGVEVGGVPATVQLLIPAHV